MAVVLTMTVVPAVLVALDKWVVYGKKNRFNGEIPEANKENTENPENTEAEHAESK